MCLGKKDSRSFCISTSMGYAPPSLRRTNSTVCKFGRLLSTLSSLQGSSIRAAPKKGKSTTKQTRLTEGGRVDSAREMSCNVPAENRVYPICTASSRLSSDGHKEKSNSSSQTSPTSAVFPIIQIQARGCSDGHLHIMRTSWSNVKKASRTSSLSSLSVEPLFFISSTSACSSISSLRATSSECA